MKNFKITSSHVRPKGLLGPSPSFLFKSKPHFILRSFKTLMLLLLFFLVLSGCKDDLEKPKPTPGKDPDKGIVTADAGPDQTTMVGQVVTLDGSNSKDSQNKGLIYNWAVTLKPVGSNLTITNPTQVKPTVVPDVAGEYELELTVSSTNGQKKDKVKVIATATADNNAAIILSTDIETDLVLEDKFSELDKADYIVTKDILVKAKLTVKPGVVIEFEANTGLQVDLRGALIAKGTASQTITFTGKQKVKGFWKGIACQGVNEMDYVVVAYGGGSDRSANLSLFGEFSWEAVTVKISNSTFSNSDKYGIALGSSTEFDTFTNNIIRENTQSAVSADIATLHKINLNTNQLVNNGHNGIAIGGTLTRANNTQEVVWPELANGATYLATDDIIIEADVKIAPGVTIEFMAEKGLYVKNSHLSYGLGYLKAKGTADKPITFTGYAKRKGYWTGIMISSSSRDTEFDHVKVSYGGSNSFSNFGFNAKTNIGLYGNIDAPSGHGIPYLKITNSEISHSGGYGLYVAGESSDLNGYSQNKFTENIGAAMYVRVNQVHKLDGNSRYSGSGNNGFNGVETEGTLAHYQEVEWPAATHMRVVGDLVIKSGVKMIGKPRGSILLAFNANKVMRVQDNGYLIAKGNLENMVSFSGNQALTHWGGIVIESNSPLNELDGVSIRGGGTTVQPGANITVRGKAKVINCRIFDSLGYGIYVTRSATINTDAKTRNMLECGQSDPSLCLPNRLGGYYQEH